MKKTYKIKLVGCDDTTNFEMELSEDEFNLLKKVSEKSERESSYSCMPKMEIEETK